MIGSGIGQSMVVQKESRCDIKGNKDINGVMLMGSQDEEDPKEVENPGERVQEIPASRRVLCDKEIQHG